MAQFGKGILFYGDWLLYPQVQKATNKNIAYLFIIDLVQTGRTIYVC